MKIRVARSFGRVCTIALTGALLLSTAGCNEPDNDDGEIVGQMPLPTDTVLNLNCADVGINLETCVLTDPENPFVDTVIGEFNENDADNDGDGAPDSFNKFELAAAIPAGPAGAKARFYFWATALARLPIGENQFYTAQALHELYTAQIQVHGIGDPIVRDQALAAYRSVLDNFFDSAAFFACDFRNGIFRGCPSPDFDPALDDRALISFPINVTVAASLHNPSSIRGPEYPSGYAFLVEDRPGDVFILALLSDWGYTYLPDIPVITVNEG